MRRRQGQAALTVVVVVVVVGLGLGLGLVACAGKKKGHGGADAAPGQTAAAQGDAAPPPICFDVTLPGPGAADLEGLAALPDGGYVAVGSVDDVEDPQLRVVRVDARGRVIFDVRHGGDSNDFGERVVVAGDGDGFIVLGTTWSSGAGLADVWLLGLDGRGQRRWARTFGDADTDTARDLVAMADGGVVFVAAARLNRDARVVRTDGAGAPRWEQLVPGVEPKGIALAGAAGLVMGGRLEAGAATLLRLADDGRVAAQVTLGGEDAELAIDRVTALPGEQVAVLGWRRVDGVPATRLLVVDARSLAVVRRQDFTAPGGATFNASGVRRDDGGLVLVGGKGMVDEDWERAWLVTTAADGSVRGEKTWAAPGARNEWAAAVLVLPDGLLIGGERKLNVPADAPVEPAAGVREPMWLRRTDLAGGACE